MAPARTSSSKAESGDGTTIWRKRWYRDRDEVYDQNITDDTFAADRRVIVKYPQNWLIAYESETILVAISRQTVGVILYERSDVA